MFAEDAEWQIRRNSAAVHGIMTALFRRRRRLLAIVATIVVFYLIVIFVPKKSEKVYGFRYVRSSYDWSQHPLKYPHRNPSSSFLRAPRVRFLRSSMFSSRILAPRDWPGKPSSPSADGT